VKIIPILLCFAGLAWGTPLEDFVAAAKEKHGAVGETAAKFLVGHMPETDRSSLNAGFLTENLDLALQARSEFPWAKAVPDEIFLNDVLPYAVFDEARDPWREDFLAKARPIVKDAKTASEAAQALNREFFKLINVHYNTGRKAPNQSPRESIASGRATCTGLSIILVNACRAVGIPARAVGTPLWANERGNHTWVEIWDGGWHFTGADEYDAKGLNRGWFTADAARAKADHPKHAIYATSWKHQGLHFPMVWAPENKQVAAVNVTSSYAKTTDAVEGAKLGIRLLDMPNGKRMIATVRLIADADRKTRVAQTKAGNADLNDMPHFDLKPGAKGRLWFTVEQESRELDFGPLNSGDSTIDAVWQDLRKPSAGISAILAGSADSSLLKTALSKQDADAAIVLLGTERLNDLAAERKREMEEKSISLGDKSMRWLEKVFGEAPADGRSLWISMHGGGGAPAAVNDSQWRNQIRLYQPTEGIYIAPRAPTDTWNLWHEGHIDPMFQRLIENHVALRGVNPDKIYLLGYSAGGDGVWQLAPRMADRFAAAAMMAGHPNEASLLGLRNLPFAIFMGAKDAAYDRNKIAIQKTEELGRLRTADPEGYIHMSRIYEGLGHWMNGKDAEALPWMAKFQRNPWPRKIIWFQDDIIHRRFYWLRIPADAEVKAGHRITASIEGQVIRLEGDVPARTGLGLSDHLIDLDREIEVIVNNRPAFKGKVPRTAETIQEALAERADPKAAATAMLTLP
jgi:hypothetical protein